MKGETSFFCHIVDYKAVNKFTLFEFLFILAKF